MRFTRQQVPLTVAARLPIDRISKNQLCSYARSVRGIYLGFDRHAIQRD